MNQNLNPNTDLGCKVDELFNMTKLFNLPNKGINFNYITFDEFD